jgi:hypothetical protein
MTQVYVVSTCTERYGDTIDEIFSTVEKAQEYVSSKFDKNKFVIINNQHGYIRYQNQFTVFGCSNTDSDKEISFIIIEMFEVK